MVEGYSHIFNASVETLHSFIELRGGGGGAGFEIDQ